MPIKIILEDGTERELPDGFPTTQSELDQIISNRVGPKSQRVSELEAQIGAIQKTRDERDREFEDLNKRFVKAERDLLVQQVAHSKGVPARWLRGDDKTELEASAEEFLADAKSIGVVPDVAGRDLGGDTGAGGAGGYVGSAGTGEEEPTRPSFEEAKKRAYERAKQQKKGALA